MKLVDVLLDDFYPHKDDSEAEVLNDNPEISDNLLKMSLSPKCIVLSILVEIYNINEGEYIIKVSIVNVKIILSSVAY